MDPQPWPWPPNSPPSQPTRKRKRALGPPASTQSLPADGLPADGLPAYSLPAPVELDTPSQSQLSQPADTTERLSHYQPSELPTTTLETRLLPPSELRDSSMFSDLTGRFPATAMERWFTVHLAIYLQALHTSRIAP